MPGDPEESRMHASRCAEIAATATTPQLKAWFSDLSMQWEKLAIELEKDFAKFVENDATSEDFLRSLDEGKRFSKSSHRKKV
jgi:hypothetical protein